MTENDPNPSWYREMEELFEDPVHSHMRWNGRTTDWFLQEKVRIVNESPVSISLGITLSTPAGWITGQLISTEEYFKLYAETFSSTFAEEQRDSIRESFANYGKKVERVEGEPIPPFQFIHLKNARLSSSGGFVPNDPGVLWRGTIASVSGFSLGELIRA